MTLPKQPASPDFVLQMACLLINTAPVEGLRWPAVYARGGSFDVAYHRGFAEARLNVSLDILDARARSFTLRVQTNVGSAYRSIVETRHLAALLSDLAAVDSQVEALNTIFSIVEPE